MGRRERRKHEKFIKGLKKNQSDHDFVESQMLRLRSEITIRMSKFQEILVRLTRELGVVKTHLTLIDRSLNADGIITKAKLEDVKNALSQKASEMFDDDNKMKGDPVVTLYNCDFDIKLNNNKVKKVNVYGR